MSLQKLSRAVLFLSLSTVSVVVAAACSSNSGKAAEPLPPLSAQEALRFQKVAESMGAIAGLSQEYVVAKKANPVGPRTRAVAELPMEARAFLSALAFQPGAKKSKTATNLKNSLDNSSCEAKVEVPEETQPETRPNTGSNPGGITMSSPPIFKLEISGPGCPVIYRASVQGVQTQTGFDGDFDLSFEALTAEAKQMSDVDRASYKGKISIGMEQPNDTSLKMNFGVAYRGGGHSQSEGDFQGVNSLSGHMLISFPKGQQRALQPPPMISMTGAMSESFEFRFKDMIAKLRSETSFSPEPKAEYFINEKSVPEEEYLSFRESLAFPGMDGIGGPTEETSKPVANLYCQVNVYDGAVLSVSELQRQISRGFPAPSGSLISSTSCSKDDVVQMKIGNDTLTTTQYQFFPQEAELNFEACPSQSGARCQSTSRFFLPNETRAYADSVAGYTVYMSCNHQRVCSARP